MNSTTASVLASTTLGAASALPTISSVLTALLAILLAPVPGSNFSTSIPGFTRQSATYESLRSHFVSVPQYPAVIARPRSGAEVVGLVTRLVDPATNPANFPFVVRSGGHDLQGRSTVDGAVTIDLRDIDYVKVSPDKKTARIGGGTNIGVLLTELGKSGLIAPVGLVPTVGISGWSMLGGYGPLTPKFGLGVDGIVSAKVVTVGEKKSGSGLLVVEKQADEELLRGIRGAGGGVGMVVTELEIKVYPKPEIQAGFLIYKPSPTVADVIRNWFHAFQQLMDAYPLPQELQVEPGTFNMPDLTFVVLFVYQGPATDPAYKLWFDRFSALAPLATSTVNTTELVPFLEAVTALLPKTVFGYTRTFSLAGPKLSNRTIDLMVQHVAGAPNITGMPKDMGTAWFVHPLPARSPSVNGTYPDGVFAVHRDHYMVELVGTGSTPEAGDASAAWARQFRQAATTQLTKEDDGLLDETYINLTGPGDLYLEKVFGAENLAWLRALKRKMDPRGVFKYTVPTL